MSRERAKFGKVSEVRLTRSVGALGTRSRVPETRRTANTHAHRTKYGGSCSTTPAEVPELTHHSSAPVPTQRSLAIDIPGAKVRSPTKEEDEDKEHVNLHSDGNEARIHEDEDSSPLPSDTAPRTDEPLMSQGGAAPRTDEHLVGQGGAAPRTDEPPATSLVEPMAGSASLWTDETLRLAGSLDEPLAGSAAHRTNEPLATSLDEPLAGSAVRRTNKPLAGSVDELLAGSAARRANEPLAGSERGYPGSFPSDPSTCTPHWTSVSSNESSLVSPGSAPWSIININNPSNLYFQSGDGNMQTVQTPCTSLGTVDEVFLDDVYLNQKRKSLTRQTFLPAGRQPILTTMWEVFNSRLRDIDGENIPTGLVALVSAKGYGKSFLAHRFMTDHAADFNHRLWVNAYTDSELLQSFANKAKDLHLPNADGNGFISNAELVSRWLRENANWLLIIDDVNDENVLKELVNPSSPQITYIPLELKGCVIVASRTPKEHIQQMLETENVINIPELETDEIKQFLLQRLRREANEKEDSALSRIAAEIGGMPLKLQECASFIQSRLYTFSEYLTAYDRKGEFPVYQKIEQFDKEFNDLQKSAPCSFFVLCVSAFINMRGIPYALFEHGFSCLREDQSFAFEFLTFAHVFQELEESSSNHSDVNIFKDILYPIRRQNLISYDVECDSFNVLKEVQHQLKKQLHQHGQHSVILETTIKMMIHICETRPSDIHLQHQLLPHADRVINRFDPKAKKCNPQLFELYCKLKLETSRIRATLNMFKMAVDIADELYTELKDFSHTSSDELRRVELRILCHRAQLFRWQGRLPDAVDLMRMCERTFANRKMKGSEVEADMCRVKAMLLTDEHKLEEAKSCLDRALKLYEDLDVPLTKENLRRRKVAHLYQLFGRYYKKQLLNEESMRDERTRNELFTRAIDAYTKACSLSEPDQKKQFLADYRHHTYRAGLAEVQYRYQKSPCAVTKMEVARRAIRTLSSDLVQMQKTFGELHRFCAWIKQTRALIMMESGEDLEEALQEIDATIMIFSDVHGDEKRHYKLAKRYYIKGEVLRKLGRLDDARTFLLKAKDTLPPNIPSPLTYNQIMEALSKVNDLLDSERPV